MKLDKQKINLISLKKKVDQFVYYLCACILLMKKSVTSWNGKRYGVVST